MKRLILIGLVALMAVGCSTTNEHDATIAKQRYDYGKIVNKQQVMFEIKGEVFCSDAQKTIGECGVIVYNTNQRYVNVEPQKNDTYKTTLNFLGKFINPLFQWKMMETQQEYSYLNQQSTNDLFSGIFTDFSDMKGAGVETNYNISDSFKDSSINDSYKSADITNTSTIEDSYKSGDSAIDSYNVTSGDSKVITSGDKIETTSGDETTTTSGDTATNTTGDTNNSTTNNFDHNNNSDSSEGT